MARKMTGVCVFFASSLCVLLANGRQAFGDISRKEHGAGLFVVALQTPDVLGSRREISGIVSFAQKIGVRTLFVQVYKSGKAYFRSEIADPSPYEVCLKAVGEDAFALLIEEAHRASIEVHAWVNALSLGDNNESPLLKKYGFSVLTRSLGGKKDLADHQIDGQYFLEPGDPRVRQDLSVLVGEIVSAYPNLDGIQFDYIRYPDVDPHYGYTDANTRRFKDATGFSAIDDASPIWQDWKRDQVTQTLISLVQKARSLKPGIKVSATGCMPYARAYHEAFQDWPGWVDRDVVDFVTVMNYSTEPGEFERWTKQIEGLVADFSKVNIALGVYKPETTADVFKREWKACEDSGSGSCVIFYYNKLLERRDLAEYLIGEEKSIPFD